MKTKDIENKIITLRNSKVIIDSDVAELYGVETKRINEAVKNNKDKFPKGYVFELSEEEWNLLKSNFSTSNKGGKVKTPKAFTEKGLYMLATILKSDIEKLKKLNLIDREGNEKSGYWKIMNLDE